MRNICRPFVLYNDFLPPGREIHSEWDYFAFGYYDGISVGENLFTGEDSSLELLWEYEKKKLRKLEGKYSEKIVFGFRSENDEAGGISVRDDEFWKLAKEKGTKYPFIFVTLLQMKSDIQKLNLENRNKLEEMLTCQESRIAISYLTLDNSDMILILLCKRYKDGTELLDRFHRQEVQSPLTKCGLSLKYSFTIAAIHRESLNNNLDAVGQVQNGPVGQAYIYVIERKPGCIDYIQNKIIETIRAEDGEEDDRVRKESILGCNDEVIVIKNVSWKSFLKLFQDTYGVLNNSCPDYQENLIGVTTIIAHEQVKCTPQVQTVDTTGGKGDKIPLLSVKLRTLTGELNRKGIPYTRQFENLSRYLYQIINSLQKFERSLFPDYIFISAFLPLNLVMLISKSVNEKTAERFFVSFYELIKGLNLYVQSATHSDRQFTQTVNFDVRIYSTPVKMNAFYNAFIYLLKTWLDTENNASEKHEYEFLTCLGVADNIGVQELFKNVSEKQRLFLVNIPENQAYNPKQMLIMLGHEVGHFVGNKVRDREGRYEHAICIMAKTIVVYFRVFLEGHVKPEEHDFIQCREYWDRLESTLQGLIREYLWKLESVDYLVGEKFQGCRNSDAEDFCRKYKKYKTYTHVLKEALIDSCTDIFKYHKEKLFGYLVEKFYIFCIMNGDAKAEDSRRQIDMTLTQAAESLIQTSVWSNWELSLKSIVEDMMYLFKECVADLIGILTLKIPMDDYLQALVDSAREQGGENNRIDDINLVRSALVVFCMTSTGGKKVSAEKQYTWDFEVLNNDAGSLSPDTVSLKKNICAFISQYLTVYSKEEGWKDRHTSSKRLYVFLSPDILEEFEKYFVKCRDMLNRYYAESPDVPEVRMNPFYQVFQNRNVEAMILEIQKYIAEYHDKVQIQIRQCAEDKDDGDEG